MLNSQGSLNRLGANLRNPYGPSAASLNLDFTASNTLDPRITFTRATTATFFNSSGVLSTAASGAARFDYNPTTLAPLGLLIEEQRTNLLTYSEQFDNAVWTKTRSSITADATTSPDGTQDADKLVEDTATNTHDMTFSASFTSGTAYTLSIYAKQAGRNLRIYFPTGAFGFAFSAVFDLSAGTATIALTGTVASITNVGNGWYRCSITQTATASATSNFTLRLIEGASTTSYTGDGTSGIFIWGAQLEAGAFPTSYIPTTTTALTRNADAASMTGTDFSSWYNQTEGTFVVNFAIPNATDSRSQLTAGDGTANERIIITNSSSLAGTAFRVVDGGSDQCDISRSQSFANNATVKVAGAYKVNDFAISQNGGSVGTDTSGTLPTVTTLFIGTNGVAQYSNSYISRIAYYPVRLANTTLQALTA
jgi:hypothetical protein